METERQQDESGYLVGKDTDPDTGKAHCEDACQSPCDQSSDEGDTDQRSEQCIFDIAGAAQASAVDDLGDLEDNDHDDEVADHNAHIKTCRIIEEQTEQIASEEEQHHGQYQGNTETDTLAQTAVYLCFSGIPFTEGTADQSDCSNLHTVAEREAQ